MKNNIYPLNKCFVKFLPCARHWAKHWMKGINTVPALMLVKQINQQVTKAAVSCDHYYQENTYDAGIENKR